jgi:hypothetical protein
MNYNINFGIPAGATGPVGPVGPAGATGLTGAIGPVGPQGPNPFVAVASLTHNGVGTFNSDAFILFNTVNVLNGMTYDQTTGILALPATGAAYARISVTVNVSAITATPYIVLNNANLPVDYTTMTPITQLGVTTFEVVLPLSPSVPTNLRIAVRQGNITLTALTNPLMYYNAFLNVFCFNI